jgi:hypothetical protein
MKNCKLFWTNPENGFLDRMADSKRSEATSQFRVFDKINRINKIFRIEHRGRCESIAGDLRMLSDVEIR